MMSDLTTRKDSLLMRIAHVITRMIVGGAQENTLFTCEDLIRDHGDEVLLITGPALGPEGDLLSQGRGDIVPQALIPNLRRAIHPVRDLSAYWNIKRQLRDFDPEVVHTHSAKGGLLGRVAAAALGIPAIVHTVHGAPFHDYQSRGARAFFCRCEKYAASRCHALISVADAMTEQLVIGCHKPCSLSNCRRGNHPVYRITREIFQTRSSKGDCAACGQFNESAIEQ